MVLIGVVTQEDIQNIHMKLAATKKKYDPAQSTYDPDIVAGIKYAVTAVYLDSIKGGQQAPHMKVSFILRQLNQFLQFIIIKCNFFQLLS